MNRRIVDKELRAWEAYATTGDFGQSNPAKVAFRCESDASQRPRILLFEGDKSDAEKAIRESNDAVLLEMLEKSKPLS